MPLLVNDRLQGESWEVEREERYCLLWLLSQRLTSSNFFFSCAAAFCPGDVHTCTLTWSLRDQESFRNLPFYTSAQLWLFPAVLPFLVAVVSEGQSEGLCCLYAASVSLLSAYSRVDCDLVSWLGGAPTCCFLSPMRHWWMVASSCCAVQGHQVTAPVTLIKCFVFLFSFFFFFLTWSLLSGC